MTSEEIAARLRAAAKDPASLLYAEDAEYVLRTAANMVEGYQKFLNKTDWVQMEYLEGRGFSNASGRHRADLLTEEVDRLRAEVARLRGVMPDPACTYYLARARGAVVLRQTRYRDLLLAGEPHPHDVCAVAGSKQQMRQTAMALQGTIDWSSIPEDE
jgi:hypothetical protein